MSKVLYSVVVLVLAFTSSQVYSQVTCPPDDGSGTVNFLADPLNCSCYYICANGFPIHSACPFPLVWDPTETSCNNPGTYHCEVSLPPSTTTPIPPSTTAGPTSTGSPTVAPTTAPPTSAAPTTAAPTSAAPTSAATSAAPTTAPSTEEPIITTESP